MEEPYLQREYAIGRISVAPVTPVIGAVVGRVDLRTALSLSDTAAIGEALRRHKVLLFHRQALSLSELVAFGRAFGTLQCYTPAAAPVDVASAETPRSHPEVHVFDYGESQRGRENFWHYDVLPNRRPALGSILRARVVPDVGGDTLFCDLAAVYDSLPDARKARLEDAIGIYDMVFERRLARFRGRAEAEVMTMSDDPLPEIPLVVQRIPGGRKVLFVNPGFLVGIKGMSAQESRQIADDIRARIDRPEFQCRFRWEADDVAFWDNRACLHYATNNYWPARRIMERITVIEADEADDSQLRRSLRESERVRT